MSDQGINKRHKERWAEATEANGGDPYLPVEQTRILQEQTRLEWVLHTKGEQKTAKKEEPDALEEGPGEEAEDQGTADPAEDGEQGLEEGGLAPADTFKTTGRGSRRGKKAPTRRKRSRKGK